MDWAIIIGLIIAGLLLLVLEVLVIPGVGVVGFFGFGLIAYSIWISFANHGTAAGIGTTMAAFLSSAIVIWLSLRSRTWRRISLETDITARVNANDPEGLAAGDKGISVGRIAPMGRASFNGKFYEVKSGDSFIDPGKELVISRIEGNQIFVKELQKTTTN